MSENMLAATGRAERGKGPARRLRANGLVPAVVYGKAQAISIVLNAKEVDTLLKKSRNKLITLNFEKEGKKEGPEKLVMIKEIQRHPLKDYLIHADLLEVAMDEKQRVKVPLLFIGTPKGVKLGGVLNYVHRELEVECLPAHIPDGIEVDISELDEGQNIHVSDLKLKAELKCLSNPRDVLVAVIKPEVEKTEPVAVAAEGAAAEGAAAEGAAAAAKPDEKEKTKEKSK